MGENSLSDRCRRQMIARDLSDSHEGEKCDCRETVNTSLLIYCKFCCIFAGEKGTRMKDGSAENTAQTTLSVILQESKRKACGGKTRPFLLIQFKEK